MFGAEIFVLKIFENYEQKKKKKKKEEFNTSKTPGIPQKRKTLLLQINFLIVDNA